MLRAGRQDRLNKSAFARRFGVHRAAIRREDMEAISGSVALHMDGSDELLVTVRAAFERCFNDLLGQGEPEKAWRAAYDWSEFLVF